MASYDVASTIQQSLHSGRAAQDRSLQPGSNGSEPVGIGRPPAHAGKAVQVDPFKPTLKAPGIKLLKLKYDKPLSDVAFKFNLRRYTLVEHVAASLRSAPVRDLEVAYVMYD
jgi:hypothetical protein